ncbi:MAG: serine hydrolase [Bacteroidota bacterium]
MKTWLSFFFGVFFLYGYSQSSTEQKIDEYLGILQKNEKLSGVVLVMHKEKPVYKKAFGYANREWRVENTIDTRFCLASVTKQFTAMVIMQMVQEGKLKLDGKISDYLPYYRKDIGEKVTIHQLLIHTSGIPNYTDLDSFMIRDARLFFTTEEFVKKYCSRDLEFEPGAKQQYNNSAYFILGAIIEQLTEKTYAQVVKENIFDPLGMKNSGYFFNEMLIEKRATGYTLGEDTLENAEPIDFVAGFSAGALYSTVEDLYLWDRALYSQKLVHKPWLDSLFRNHKNGFGYGWFIDEWFGKKCIHHSGGVNGFSTHIARMVNDDICIVTLMNYDFGAAGRINKTIAAILLGEKYELPVSHTEIQLSEEAVKKYTGEYELSPDFKIVITSKGNKLYCQATGQPRFRAYAEAENKFFLKIVEASMTFETDKKGNVTGMTLHQGGDQKIKKVK